MITIDQIKELRKATGVGVGAVKEALEISKGDIDAAIKYLREKGMAKSAKRKDKVAENGVLGTYVHSNNKFVVVVEVSCETDFAEKSEQLKKFANDIALHIAGVGTKYISVETIDAAALDGEKQTYMQELEGKPENVKEKILEGKLEKFYKDNVLLKQQLFTDDSKTVEDYLSEMVAQIGEKIEITQFYKFQVSEAVVASKLA